MSHFGIDGQARKGTAPFKEVSLEGQWNKSRFHRRDLQTELLCDVIAKTRCPDLRYRQPAGGDDKRVKADLQKWRLCDRKAAGVECKLVKLHRPPPEILIFSAGLLA